MTQDLKTAERILRESNAAIDWALKQRGTTTWMREALSQALGEDPVAIAVQVDLLKHLVDRRVAAWLPIAFLPPFGKTDA